MMLFIASKDQSSRDLENSIENFIKVMDPITLDWYMIEKF